METISDDPSFTSSSISKEAFIMLAHPLFAPVYEQGKTTVDTAGFTTIKLGSACAFP